MHPSERGLEHGPNVAYGVSFLHPARCSSKACWGSVSPELSDSLNPEKSHFLLSLLLQWLFLIPRSSPLSSACWNSNSNNPDLWKQELMVREVVEWKQNKDSNHFFSCLWAGVWFPLERGWCSRIGKPVREMGLDSVPSSGCQTDIRALTALNSDRAAGVFPCPASA